MKAEAPAHADMIVVLAGDARGNRIMKAGDLIRGGYATKALISGPFGSYDRYESELAIEMAVRRGYPESFFIPLPNHATSTRDEAEAILGELRRRGIHSILLVTSDYHTRRAGSVYRRFASDISVRVIAASDQDFHPDRWWKSRQGRKQFLFEYLKTFAETVGL